MQLQKEFNFFKQTQNLSEQNKKTKLAFKIIGLGLGFTFLYSFILLIGIICNVFSDSQDSSYKLLTQEESNLQTALKNHNEKGISNSLYLLSKTHYYGMPHIEVAKDVRLSHSIKNIINDAALSDSLKQDAKQFALELKLNHPEQFEQEMNHYYSCSKVDFLCHYFRSKDLQATHEELQKNLPIFNENMRAIGKQV